MILDVFQCFQLFSAGLEPLWMTTPCAHILWSSLYEVWNFRQDQDASVGNRIGPNLTTYRVLEAIGKTISGSFSIPFGSGLEVQSQHVYHFSFSSYNL